MHGEIKRKTVEWERANCKGLDTNIFYTPMAELLEDGMSYRTLRTICFNCPIWEQCLQVAIQEEAYGFWGGLSEEERKHLYNGTRPRSMKQLQMDLKMLQVSYEHLLRVIRRVKRKFSYSGGVQM